MTGSSASFTVTMKLQLAVLPLASVAVQVTVLAPVLKILPLVGVQLTVTPGQLSVDRKSVVQGKRVDLGGGRIIKKKDGKVICGGSLSLTRTRKLPLVWLARGSA